MTTSGHWKGISMEHRVGSTLLPATARTLELMASHNQERRCTFLIASNYLNPPAAAVGYLLDDLLGAPGPRVSYLVSSGLEALSGAIKLTRHAAVRAGRDDGGWVMVLDEKDRYRDFMDPVDLGAEDALIPHVVSVTSVRQARQQLGSRRWAAVIVVREEHMDPHDPDLSTLLEHFRRDGGLVVLSNTELDLTSPGLFEDPIGADVVVFGESLADRQVPFGAFTLTPRAHAVWRNDVDCFAQTSTFGGNVLCATIVRDALRRNGFITEDRRKVLHAIDTDAATAAKYWGRHINPNMAGLAKTFGLDIEISQAQGGRFTTAEGWDVIDCAGGVGSNLRGHNPPDLVPEVLDRHDPAHDYTADLNDRLAALTGLPHAFPAVSGATANDIAVAMGALANPRRRLVVTFDGNYGGKTLFSLNLSKHGPQQTESDEDAFRPYYRGLVHIDPFAEGAAAKLETLLRGGEVAMVWFELVQGAMCRPLPDDVLAVINDNRAEHGYLIGVDEVLTGGWRGGEHFVAHRGTVPHADIVTLGKTLSDMTLPVAVAMVSEDVHARAMATAPRHVERLRGHFTNNLGAHIASHALATVDKPGDRVRSRAAYAELVETLNGAFDGSKVFGPVAGTAAHLRLTMNPRWFPFHHRSKIGNLLEMTLSDLLYRRCQVFLPALRIMHRVAADPADLVELAERLAVGAKGISPLMVYRYAFGRAFAPKLPLVGKALIGRAATRQG